MYDVIIVGGGAAGFFTAINIAERYPKCKIVILEKGKKLLTKVKISGGGRCNVTHACFEIDELIKAYPRGGKELKGAFYKFSPWDTIDWFHNHGVALKTERDNRVFPISNNSQTIIDCFLKLTKQLNIEISTEQNINYLQSNNGEWLVSSSNKKMQGKKLVLTTGSNPKVWHQLDQIGHSIISPVPSLFTFNITDKTFKALMGISVRATATIEALNLTSSGWVLITHWGFSGPAILKLSAWGARQLAKLDYTFILSINWLNNLTFDETLEQLKATKHSSCTKSIHTTFPFDIPNRLWKALLQASQIDPQLNWGNITNKQLGILATQLTKSVFQIKGKSVFKEEFVTAGGVNLKEVNFRTMESTIKPALYFAGEILNIDGITGGFNFQNAWTNAFIIANNIKL